MNSEQQGRSRRLQAFLKANVALVAITSIDAIVFVGGLALLVGLNPGIAVGLLVVILAASVGVYRVWNGRFDLGARQPLGRAIASGLVGLVVVALAIQAVPYGRDHTNPPVTSEPNWDSPRTRDLAAAACFDCHSNETEYPAYASIAPFSWAVRSHVEEGRARLNFSEWNRPTGQVGETAETVREGTMPPFYYTIAHPAARLSDAEKRELADGLRATTGG